MSKDLYVLTSQYPEYVQKVKQNYRRNFLLVVLESCVFTVSLAVLAQDTILPLLVSHLSAQPIFIGLIPAIYYLGYYMPQILGAYLVHDRERRKGIVFWITVVQRIVTILMALIIQAIIILPAGTILVLFFFLYTIFSFTNGMIGPPYSDLINKMIIYKRGIFFGVLTGVTGLIGFGMSIVTKILLDRYSFPVNFQIMFWVACGISMLSPIFVAALREIPFPEIKPVESLVTYLKSVPDILTNQPAYRRYLIGRALVGLAIMANSFYAVYALQHFSLSPGTIGIFAMMVLISKSLMGFVWGWLGDRFGYKLVLLGVGATLFLEAFLALVIQSPFAFYVIAFLIGSVLSGIWINDPNMIFEIAPPAETGRYIGITNTLVGPVMVLAPLLGGVLVNLFSYQALFWVCLTTAVAGFLFVLLKVKEPRKV